MSPKANTRPRTCHELASLTDFELAHARGLDGEIEPNWGALFHVPSTTKVKTYFHFAGTYQLLGSLLLLYKDGLANELNGAVASGFGGGPWP